MHEETTSNEMDASSRGLPARVASLAEAYRRFPEQASSLFPALHRCDPLADAVVQNANARSLREVMVRANRLLTQHSREPADAAMQMLIEEMKAVPAWVDWRVIHNGGRLLFRSGALGGMVLATRSLVYGYAAPAGNKPLMFSGQLRWQVPKRLAETARFVADVCAPSGLRYGQHGFQGALHVRLMHAWVRHSLLQSGRWQSNRWGEPINQHDMVATMLLFSLLFIDGIRKVGVSVSAQEEQDYLHLWRYCAYLLGTEDELLPKDAKSAWRTAQCIELTQGAPDDDSRELVRALLETPLFIANTRSEKIAAMSRVAVSRAACRYLIGDEMADQLQIPSSRLTLLMPSLRRVVATSEHLREGSTFLDFAAEYVGRSHWYQASGLSQSPSESPHRGV